MAIKHRRFILFCFDLLLASGATATGIFMLQNFGIFLQYPVEWHNRLPFDSWLIPGILTLVIFGIGNLTAAIACLKPETKAVWLPSIIMGWLLFLVATAQVLLLDTWFLATVQTYLLSVIQLVLGVFLLAGLRKSSLSLWD